MTDFAFEQLKGQMRGPLLLPDDEAYDAHRRVWNRLFDHRPAAIARCTGVADVIAAVNFARVKDILLAVRGGGHSYAGNSSCDGGLLIDLSLMDGIQIDPGTRRANVQAGTRWDAFFREAEVFGLAVPAGPPQAGVAGVALGGGVGPLSRKWGLTLDNLLSADVVTANGEFVVASAEENPDLFWALRGGTGNFGVVTSLELQLHELGPELLAGQIIHPWDDARSALAFLRDFVSDAPDEVGILALIFTLPPLEFFPAEQHGKSALCFVACYAGDPAEGRKALAPLRAFGNPMVDTVAVQTYAAFKHADDAAIEAWERVYPRSHNLRVLSDEAIDIIVERGRALAGTATLLGILPMTGQISRIASDATAFPHRGGVFEFDIWAAWSDPTQDDEVMGWAREFHDALAPFADGGAYVNILGADESERVPQAYEGNYERLCTLKAKWDPTNLFRRNHNIIPRM